MDEFVSITDELIKKLVRYTDDTGGILLLNLQGFIQPIYDLDRALHLCKKFNGTISVVSDLNNLSDEQLVITSDKFSAFFKFEIEDYYGDNEW